MLMVLMMAEFSNENGISPNSPLTNQSGLKLLHPPHRNATNTKYSAITTHKLQDRDMQLKHLIAIAVALACGR